MIEAVRSASVIYLDSPPLIYYIQEHRTFSKVVRPIIEAIARGEKEGVSSYLTLLELLIMPLMKGREDLAAQYRHLLLKSAHMRLLPLEEGVAEEAARIRAGYRFRTPDAIQLASAKLAKADLFVTNDKRLRSFSEIHLLILSDHLV